MGRLLIVNNAPTPYRTFMFNRLCSAGREFGIEVEVAYQAERIHAHPEWKPQGCEQQFPFWYSRRGFPLATAPRPFFDRWTLHLDILAAAWSRRYTHILCAPFMGTTSALIALMPLRATRRLLWSENHADSTGDGSPFKRWLKRVLARRFDAIVVPGERAAEHLCGIDRRFTGRAPLLLPNIVDRSVFRGRTQAYRLRRQEVRRDLGLPAGATVILSIGRLEDGKGYGGAIAACVRAGAGIVYCVVGNGSQLEEYRERVRNLGLAGRILFPGGVSEERVVQYFAVADWFWHPALVDRSPLVCVEALTAGLPMCVSNQTGNAPETVVPDRNGFCFDGADGGAIAGALARMMATSSAERERMGNESARMAAESFDPEAVARRFFVGLLRV